MIVTILDDYLDTLRTLHCFRLLDGHDVTVCNDHTDDVDALAARLCDTEALVLIRERTAITGELLERLPHLRLISQRSAYPHIDVDACTRLGVVVCSDVRSTAPSYSTAELTWALVLAAFRQIPEQVAGMKRGEWQVAVGRSLIGKMLGVYGYGRIGKVVAGYGTAFGMKVQVWGRRDSVERAGRDGLTAAPSRESFFESSDVVSLHLRLVDATRGIVTLDDLSRMKPSALLVNTSRAGLVAEGALVQALHAGRPGMAALDVYDVEPLTDPTDPLLLLENVLCTPHIGYVTREDLEAQFHDVFRQINAFAEGDPINVVNPGALGRR